MGAKILIYYRLTIKWDDSRIEWVGHYSQSPFGIHPFNCISSRCTNLIRAYVGISSFSTFKFSFLSSHSKRESKTMFKLLNATWRYADIRPHEKSIKMLTAPKCAKRWDAIIWMNAELELINATTALNKHAQVGHNAHAIQELIRTTDRQAIRFNLLPPSDHRMSRPGTGQCAII